MTTLVYLAVRPDAAIPWGGLHITVAGPNHIGKQAMTEKVRACLHVLDKKGWFMHDQGKSAWLEMPYIKVRSRMISRFAAELRNQGVKVAAGHWHVTLHGMSAGNAQELLRKWSAAGRERPKFRAFVVQAHGTNGLPGSAYTWTLVE